MKRRILLVDDEVAVLLTMKAVLEISGFDVDTAASARDGKLRLRNYEYSMVITDMRMENDQAGRDVIRAARNAPYRPAVALLTAFPVDEADWQGFGADQLLLKPMHTRVLLQQIEKLFTSHQERLASLPDGAAASEAESKKQAVKKIAAVKKTSPVKKTAVSAKAVQAKKVAKPAKTASKSRLKAAGR